MPQSVRIGDINVGTGSHGFQDCPHQLVGVFIQGSPNVDDNDKASVRIGDMYVHNCEPEGSELWTFSGLKKVEDIGVNDFLVLNGVPEEIKTIHKRWYSGNIYKVVVNEFYGEHWLTEEHPLFVGKFHDTRKVNLEKMFSMEVKDVHKGMRVVSGFSDREGLNISLDRMYLYGVYLGDGTYDGRGKEVQITYGIHEQERAVQLIELIKKEFNVEARNYLQERKSFGSLRFMSTEFIELFGKRSWEKKVPDDWVQKMNDKEFKALYEGLASSDGAVQKRWPKNRYSKTCGEQLMKQLYLLAFCLGHSVHLAKRKNVGFRGEGEARPQWELRVSYEGSSVAVRNENYVIRRIKDVVSKPYEGWVYGFETVSGFYDALYRQSNCPHCGIGFALTGSPDVDHNGIPSHRIGDVVNYTCGVGVSVTGSPDVDDNG